jgi:hypothetical protein
MLAAKAAVRWNQVGYTRDLRLILQDRLYAVGREVVAVVRENIAQVSPPRSQPGDFPHREFGELSASIDFRVNRNRLRVEVFSDSPYALPLELGTRNMAARPFLRRSLVEARSRVRAVMLIPLPRSLQKGQFVLD